MVKFCGQEIVKVNVSHEEADYPTIFFLYADKYKLDKVNCANSSLYCWGVLGGNLLVDKIWIESFWWTMFWLEFVGGQFWMETFKWKSFSGKFWWKLRAFKK